LQQSREDLGPCADVSLEYLTKCLEIPFGLEALFSFLADEYWVVAQVSLVSNEGFVTEEWISSDDASRL